MSVRRRRCRTWPPKTILAVRNNMADNPNLSILQLQSHLDKGFGSTCVQHLLVASAEAKVEFKKMGK